MQFEIDKWTIKRLIEEYEAGSIALNPPYQRNPVWTLPAQQSLIESILAGKAIPNFFLLRKDDGTFEMIDGQQRARTILAYWKNQLVDHEHLTFDQRLAQSPNRQATKARFLDYLLCISVITALHDNESVEEYYALLNSAGLRLNRPELKKAEYFQTNFLKLVMDLTRDERLTSLKLFNASSAARMNDVDFVSELVALLKFGISDKKEKVDQLYEDDVTLGEMKALQKHFAANLDTFQRFNHIAPIIRTRYKQKNDFYTLFYLFYTVRALSSQAQDHFYRVLTRIGPYIRPSQDKCEPFRDYAYHCVTQSNSKAARQARNDILTNILCSDNAAPNPTQQKIMQYFGLSNDCLVQVEHLWTFDPHQIRDPHNHEFEFTDDEV